MIEVVPSGRGIGAQVRGLDTSRELSAAQVAALRAALLEHCVLAFRDQRLTDEADSASAPCPRSSSSPT